MRTAPPRRPKSRAWSPPREPGLALANPEQGIHPSAAIPDGHALHSIESRTARTPVETFSHLRLPEDITAGSMVGYCQGSAQDAGPRSDRMPQQTPGRAGARCLQSPSATAGDGRKARRVRAMERAHCAVSTGMCCGRNRPSTADLARTRRARRRCEGRPSLWWLSLGRARESHRPAGMRDEQARTPIGFRQAEQTKANTWPRRTPSPRPQGCGTNQQGRRWVLVRTHEQNLARGFGVSRNPQPCGCATNKTNPNR